MFDIEDHGTIVLVRPQTEDVRQWLVENTDGTWFGGALAVEPRYVGDIVAALVEEGYALQ